MSRTELFDTIFLYDEGVERERTCKERERELGNNGGVRVDGDEESDLLVMEKYLRALDLCHLFETGWVTVIRSMFHRTRGEDYATLAYIFEMVMKATLLGRRAVDERVLGDARKFFEMKQKTYEKLSGLLQSGLGRVRLQLVQRAQERRRGLSSDSGDCLLPYEMTSGENVVSDGGIVFVEKVDRRAEERCTGEKEKVNDDDDDVVMVDVEGGDFDMCGRMFSKGEKESQKDSDEGKQEAKRDKSHAPPPPSSSPLQHHPMRPRFQIYFDLFDRFSENDLDMIRGNAPVFPAVNICVHILLGIENAMVIRCVTTRECSVSPTLLLFSMIYVVVFLSSSSNSNSNSDSE